MNILEPEDKPKGLNDSVVSSKHQVNRQGLVEFLKFFQIKGRNLSRLYYTLYKTAMPVKSRQNTQVPHLKLQVAVDLVGHIEFEISFP